MLGGVRYVAISINFNNVNNKTESIAFYLCRLLFVESVFGDVLAVKDTYSMLYLSGRYQALYFGLFKLTILIIEL